MAVLSEGGSGAPPRPPLPRNDAETSDRLRFVGDIFRSTFGVDPNPGLAMGLATSFLPNLALARFIAKSAPIIKELGEGIMREPSTRGASPQAGPTPPPPSPTPGPRPSPATLTVAPPPVPQPRIGPEGQMPKVMPNPADMRVRYDVDTLADVRAMLIGEGFLAESQIPRGPTGDEPVEAWDQATVKAFLRWKDRNYKNLSEMQERAIQAGYGYDPKGKELKADGVLSSDWVRAFGEMANDELAKERAIQEAPWWLAPAARALPSGKEMRQLWYEISGRKGHGDIDVLTPVTRTLHVIGTSLALIGNFFPGVIAINYARNFSELQKDPEYNEAMDRAYRALGIRTRDQMTEAAFGIGREFGEDLSGSVLATALSSIQGNEAAKKALDEAAQVRARYMKKMPDATYAEMFGVVNRKQLQEDQNLATTVLASDIAFDLLLFGKISGGRKFIPRGDPQHILDNRGARRLAGAVANDIAMGRNAAAFIKLGESHDAKRLLSALLAGERRARKTGGHITSSSVLRSMANTYGLQSYNIKTSLDRSAQMRAWLLNHSDLAVARMVSIRPKSGSTYLKQDPNIYKNIIRYAREVYRNPVLVDGVAEKLARAKSSAEVGKVVDDINADLGRYYRGASGEAGGGVAYLGDASNPNAFGQRLRSVAGHVVLEPTPLLPSEQRARAGFANLRYFERKPVDLIPGAPPPSTVLEHAEQVADHVYNGTLRGMFDPLNTLATPMRLLFTVGSPILATRKYVTALIRRVQDVGLVDDGAKTAFLSEVNISRKHSKRLRFLEDELDHTPVGYEIGTDGPVRSVGGRWRAQEQPRVARDFFRRLYDDELVGVWLRAATGPGSPRRPATWDFAAAEAAVAKWLSSARGVRLSEMYDITDAAGNADTAYHAQQVAKFLQSYADAAPETMFALANRTGMRTDDLKRVFGVLETTRENPWVSGLLPAAESGMDSTSKWQSFVHKSWMGRLDTTNIPVVGTWLATHGVEEIPYGLALPMAHERRKHFEMLAGKIYRQMREENPTASRDHQIEAAMEMALERTHQLQLDLSRMWNVEASMRWAAFFGTKKRLWYSMLWDQSMKNPGLRGAYADIVQRLERENADQPEHLRYSIGIVTPMDTHLGPKGTEVRVPIDRMLWLAELPLWSSLFIFPIIMLGDRSKAAEEAEKGRVSASRFDSAIHTGLKMVDWANDPKKFREDMGETEYHRLLEDPRTDPETLRLFIFEHPDLSRHYWRTNHQLVLASLRGESITREEAEKRAMWNWVFEQGAPLVRPVTGTVISPERREFNRAMAQYEAITDEKERAKFFEKSKPLQEWRYMYDDPERRKQLVDGWNEYFAARAKMDEWAASFYGPAGDVDAIRNASLNRYEAFQQEEWFQQQIDDITKRYPEWGRVFLDDDRTDSLVAQRKEAYEGLVAVFPNLKISPEDINPTEKDILALRALDGLNAAGDLFRGTAAEEDYSILIAEARRMAPDLIRFSSPARNPNEAVVKRYIQQVYYPAMDKLSYYFDLIEALRKNKVPTSSPEYSKVYKAIRETRDALSGPFTIDGVQFPGIEEVQWGSWDEVKRLDHLIAWVTLPPAKLTKFQKQMVDRNDRTELRQIALERRRSGRKLLGEAGL